MRTIHLQNIIRAALLCLVCIVLSACYDEGYEGVAVGNNDSTITVKLAVQTRATTAPDGYSVGNTWENYIDISNLDFKIYFFTYDSTMPQEGTLIAELYTTDATVTEEEAYTEYTIDGNVLATVAQYDTFRVVVLANWGRSNYPSVVAGQTTIDALVEGDTYSRFSAENFLSATESNATHNIPFYGVQEFTGVTWSTEGLTDLTTTGINMLRALAKVEVVRTDTSVEAFSSVEIHRYNSTGYCAPQGVYTSADYFHNYDWDSDFTSSLHLVGGANDSSTNGEIKTYAFNKVSDDDNTWVIYLPEYDNSSTDFSYITVSFVDGSEDKTIYFGNYTNGVCTAYDSDGNAGDRYNICRNYYYRFTVQDISSFSYSPSPAAQNVSATPQIGITAVKKAMQ